MSSRLRLLLIDDNPDDRRLVLRELCRQFNDPDVEQILDRNQLDQVLAAREFDVVITDYQLRWADGLDILRELKAARPDRPVIMFTASGTQEVAVAAMKAGVDDYIVKSPTHYARLPLAVESCLRQARHYRALEESEKRLRLAIEGRAVSVFSQDETGRFTSVYNPQLPYLTSDMLGKTDEEVLPPEVHSRLMPLKAEVIASGRPVRQEVTFRIQGEDRTFDISLQPLAQQSRIVGLNGSAADVTERKRLEDELRRRVEELALSDRRKEEFMAMLGHELRNPLAPIRSAIEIMLMEEAPDSQQRELLDLMARQVSHMVRIIDDLLEISRLARGKITLRKETFDLTELVRRAAEDSRPMLEEADLTLRLDVPASPILFRGDTTRIAQVLENLLHNARKFTDAGGDVGIVITEERPGYVQIRVWDTGIGIDTETMGRLFESFTQADRSLDRSRGGLGVGLALVKGLVELHKGRVWAESEGIGKGALFTVELPLTAIRPGETRRPQESAAVRRKYRVAVIEDNADAAKMMQRLLEAAGHEVATAGDGRSGLMLVDSMQPDVVLCDLGLPGGMSGYEVAKSLRARDRYKPLLVAISGYGQREDKERAVEAGFDVHLTKPVEHSALVQAFSSLAGVSRQGMAGR